MSSLERLTAYAIITLAVLTGGGSLLLFGAFVVSGPFNLIQLDLSEAQIFLWDGFLSTAFFLQHSGMIRPSFRSWLSSRIPAHYCAATYAIASGTVLTVVLLFWQSSSTTLWVPQGMLRLLFGALFPIALAGFIWGTWALGTFDPFGRISILSHLDSAPQASRFIIRGPYLWVRHPLYLFTLLLIWGSPAATADRLFFNALWTLWIAVGTCLEERNLVLEFGDSYRRYQRTVPMLLPWKGRANKASMP